MREIETTKKRNFFEHLNKGICSNKRGQFQLSFGMIFSIFIIAATVAVAIYAIVFFLDFQKCSEIGLFYQDLKGDVDKAWVTPIVESTFGERIPSAVDYVCFGNLTQEVSAIDRDRRDELRRRGGVRRNNVFIFPPGACEGNLASFSLRNAEVEEFFCNERSDGEVSVKLSKDVSDALVKLSR